MGSLKGQKGERVHTRGITVTTYEHDDNHIVVEGELKDDRLQSYYTLLGNKNDPQTIHHMIIRMLVECSTLKIQGIEAEMPEVPEDGCPTTLKSLEKIKGLTISSGFTGKVKKRIGGPKGCSHLTTLLLAMAPAVLQGHFAKFAKIPFPEELTADHIKAFLSDTCRIWRKDGPLLKEITAAISKKK